MAHVPTDAPVALGRQVLLDLHGCDPVLLRDPGHVRRIMESGAVAARATIIRSLFHRFSPQGISGVVIIAESHLTIHTWPEHGLASIDIYTSGLTADPSLAVPVLQAGFKAARAEVRELSRGRLCP
jgi:S-adenosylmethionine decarboxylase proenzyme